jgi:chromosome segregation protein
MHLSSLTLRGFKSFPERTKLEFTRGVSVIVGPNGSGKSNITDAVLWAMGEQSPLAVRGQSMQDVIFAGAHGVQARSEAEVEVVLDNASGAVDLPAGEISIVRRLNRAGEGEYRINGARCRLADVIELLSDTGLGREMHSVVSQGRVEAIVTSKPRDRRLLIEEAAGLGKHRKRRRRAQLKLERTEDNLGRALDVEREARTRLRPLKRQAEAAELHERLQRQTDETRWTLLRDAARAARAELAEAEAAVARARASAGEVETQLSAVEERRERAEQALSARATEREALSARFYAARSAAERIELRREAAARAVAQLAASTTRRSALIAELESLADVGDDGAAERIAALEAELARAAEESRDRLEREVAELETRRAAAAEEVARLAAAADAAARVAADADAAAEAARRERSGRSADADRARAAAARVGAELAQLNQFLRLHAGAPGGAPALADALTAEPGYELALVAALGSRLRAAVAEDLGAAAALLERAGRDGGAALIVPAAAAPLAVSPPAPGAEPLAARVRADGEPASRLAAALLSDVWVVDDVATLPPDFACVAVTRAGRVWSPAARELRQVPPGGEDRVLAERNRRSELLTEVERAAQAEQAAIAALEAAEAAVAEADAALETAERDARTAARARDDAAEAERHAGWLIRERRAAPAEGAAAQRGAELESALATERRLVERAERERAERAARIDSERAALAREEALRPPAERLATALHDAAGAVAVRVEALGAELAADRAAGERLAGELRACAAEESQVQARLKAAGEAVTRGEVAAQRARDRAGDVDEELGRLAARLGLAAEPADTGLPGDERDGLETRIERLQRRREQLGPVNPLAAAEYREAVEHVEELERQRQDLENALRELEALIRDIDRRIREAFEATFTAAADNFEAVAEELFPGGRGRLRLVREDAGPRPVLGGGEEAAAPEPDDEEPPEDRMGVEIEITPAGKSTKRLSLLSGGEKSLTALAFLFAVFLARPCPFYILDEVEAALDDLNIDRFLALLRRFADRAQFIVVTHQRRTMEAADCLYGVSMAGNGVSKVISRRLPASRAEQDAA